MRNRKISAIMVIALTGVLIPSVSFADTAAPEDPQSVELSGVILGGPMYIRPQPLTFNSGEPWLVVDARGTVEPWTVNVSAELSDDAGHHLDPSFLTLRTGPVTAGGDSDPAPQPATVVLSNKPQTWLGSGGEAKGGYTFTPKLSVTGTAPDSAGTLVGTIFVSIS
jgi:hypothetical protein